MIIVVFEDEMGDADGGIDIPCKIIKKESIIEPLDTNFDDRFWLSHCEAVQVDVPDSEPCVTEDDDQECAQSLPPENPCINTSFSHIEKHLISEWNFPESYSDDYDISEENFRKVCTDFVGKLSITGNEMAEIRYKQGVSLKIHSGLNIDVRTSSLLGVFITSG